MLTYLCIIVLSFTNFINNVNNINNININKFKNKNYLRKKNILLKFEEENDYNIDNIFFNNTVSEKYKKNINFSNIKLNMENEFNNINDNKFPSFYDFLKEREIKELDEKNEYLNNKKYKNFKSTSKDLKLLTSVSTAEWCKTWLYEMVHVPDYFPTFMYQDMFRMRDFSQKNNTKKYFFIGYYPCNSNLRKGPFYIGAFELIPQNREFRSHIIIQNPYYCVENIYDYEKIINFKKELIAMTKDAYVFFKYDNLKDTSDQRYFYSWLYEE